MQDKRLTETVPVRMSRKQKIALRRWARLARADVSDVVRDLVEERMCREAQAEASAQASVQESNAQPIDVAA